MIWKAFLIFAYTLLFKFAGCAKQYCHVQRKTVPWVARGIEGYEEGEPPYLMACHDWWKPSAS